MYRLCQQGNEMQVQEEINSRPKVAQTIRRVVSDMDEEEVWNKTFIYLLY